MKFNHYHVYVRVGQNETIHEEIFKTKKEAAKAITKLKRGYEVVKDDNGNPLPFRDSLKWEGEAQYGYVESQVENLIIYGQKHTKDHEQIHHSCEAEHGWIILGW